MNYIDFPVAPSTFWSPLAAPLLNEWNRLNRRSATHRRIAEWAIPGCAPAIDLDSLLSLVGLFGDPRDDEADARLAAVMQLAATDDLAARLALHRVLPSLVAVATRRARKYATSRQVAFDDLVAHAWIVIRTYPIERRPRRVAAGLVRDIEYRTFVRDHRLRSADELPMSDGPIATEPDRTVESEPMMLVIELLRDARSAGVDSEDLRFAAEWATGSSTVELAKSFDLCERSVRNRRIRVAAGLRSVALHHTERRIAAHAA